MRHLTTFALALGVILAAPVPTYASGSVRNHAHRIAHATIPSTATALAPWTTPTSVSPATGRVDQNEVYEPEPFSHYWR